ERDGVEEDVAADAAVEQLLDLDQVRRHRHADAVTGGVDEVDDDLLVFDEVVVEAHGLPGVGDELDVGQAALLEALAGGERVAPEEGQALLSGALGPGQGGAEQRRSEQGRGAEPRQDLSSTGGHGSVLLSPVSAT